MIDFSLVKDFFSGDVIKEKKNLHITFKHMYSLSEEDLNLLRSVIDRFVNSHFIFSSVRESVLTQLMEKLNEEEKKKICILGKHGEKNLNDYTACP